jgi:hypothetical protein
MYTTICFCRDGKYSYWDEYTGYVSETCPDCGGAGFLKCDEFGNPIIFDAYGRINIDDFVDQNKERIEKLARKVLK